MDKLEEGIRARAPQLLDHAEALAAAAVHRDAGGLVDAEQRIVLMDHLELARGGRRTPGALGDPDGRDPHLVAEGEPRVGRSARHVHPDFARADHPVQVRARHAFQGLDEEVVEALAGRGRVDADVSHARARPGHGGGRPGGPRGRGCPAFAPYNALLHSPAASC